MKDFLKTNFKQGNTVVFDNETSFSDTQDFVSMECRQRIEKRNAWANGYLITFNGQLFGYKTFDAFFKKFEQLKSDYNLQLKSW